MKNLFWFPLIILFLNMASCARDYTKKMAETYAGAIVSDEPDYSDLDYWAAHPSKWDPSDSVPKPLRKKSVKTPDADVFFLHPTTLTDMGDMRWNAPLTDNNINAKTDYSSILYQASIFNESCKVFAPRYRQAHIKCFYKKSQQAEEAFELAYADIKKAFDHYLKHENKGRPIIIAAHSQGTKHAGSLLKEFFENKPLQKQLVCAYIIGMPVPENYFTRLKPCTNSTETGCFVSWRTYKTGFTDTLFVKKEAFKAVVVNPLTWSNSPAPAPRSLNKGAVLKKFNKVKPGNVRTRINGNVLWSSKPRFFGNIFLRSNNYHIADMNLFYKDIRENVRERLEAFKKHSPAP